MLGTLEGKHDGVDVGKAECGTLLGVAEGTNVGVVDG